ncbi:MAG: PA2778 family cysteine peptidase [Steroidobacteraceae bacterium]
MIRAALPTAALLWSLAGCAASPPLAAGLPAGASRSIELGSTPFFAQEEYQCGPAALATLLRASGIAILPPELTPQVYVPGRRGSLQAELIGAARRHGRLPYVLAPDGGDLVAELSEGRPVLVLQNLRVTRWPRWHYAVLIGYDADRNVAILRSGTRERIEMRWQKFARTWHLGGRWAITTLKPGVVPEHADAARYIEAAAGLEAAGRRAEAQVAYDAAIARWPEAALAWLGRGNVAYGDGKLDAAAESYLRAVELAPGNAAARNNLAQVLADANCLAEARVQLARAATLAAGTALAAAVAESLAKIESLPPAATGCRFPGRAWTD